MEAIVDINTKDTVNLNRVSTQIQDLGDQISSSGTVAQNSDIDMKNTILDREKIGNENTGEIVDVPTDVQIDIQENALVDVPTNIQIDVQENALVDVQGNVQLNIQADAQMDAQADVQIDAPKNVQIDAQTDAQIDVQGNVQAGAQIDVELDTQVDRQLETQVDTQNLQYRSKVDEVLLSGTSDSESDSSSSSTSNSDSSSSSSDSSSDSDNDDSDDNNDIRKRQRKITYTFKQEKVQSELDSLPPVEDLKISVPKVDCVLFGEVVGIVEKQIIVKPKPDKPALREETVLFVDQGQRTLGKIFDLFGQVKEPYYTVRFNSDEHIQEKGVIMGTLVYYCPNNLKYTFFVFLSEITKIKACDSNDGSGGEHPDFSDDEQEKRYYQKLSKQRKYNTQSSGGGTRQQSKRRCTSNTQKVKSQRSNSTPSKFTSRASSPSLFASNSPIRPRGSLKRNYQPPRHNEYRQWSPWMNNQFNQCDMYRPPYCNPRNAHYMHNMEPPYQGTYAVPSFNIPPPQYINYNAGTDMSTQYRYASQYSDLAFNNYGTFDSLYNSNYSVPSSYSDIHANFPSVSLSLPPPPPPPSTPPPTTSTTTSIINKTYNDC